MTRAYAQMDALKSRNLVDDSLFLGIKEDLTTTCKDLMREKYDSTIGDTTGKTYFDKVIKVQIEDDLKT